MIVDTHCHIHQTEFYSHESRDMVYRNARQNHVAMICASTDQKSSEEAVDFVRDREHSWALVGVHPHEAKHGADGIDSLLVKRPEGLVGIGEIGLDYYYEHSERADQIRVFEQQLALALQYDLPVSFHVRDTTAKEKYSVWDDFWPIIDNCPRLRGVLHSFTDTREQLERGFERGFFVGVNGISTFTKDALQQQLYASIPLEKMLLETDAPFLTPAPHRGRMNEPSFVKEVAERMAVLRGVSPDFVAASTTINAKVLFALTSK
jgi:TatD DNase family protein